MTYQEAQQKLLIVRWKVQEYDSHDGTFYHIEPEETVIIHYEDKMEIIITGDTSKEIAEHIVSIHNEALDRKYNGASDVCG